MAWSKANDLKDIFPTVHIYKTEKMRTSCHSDTRWKIESTASGPLLVGIINHANVTIENPPDSAKKSSHKYIK